MRRWPIAIVLALAAPAAADPVPDPPITVGAFGDATHLGGIQAGGFGVDLELAHRIAPRWELFGETALAWLAVGVLSEAQSGIQGRLGGGARWYARTWGDRSESVHLYLEASAGENGYWWSGGRFARGDVDLGWGWAANGERYGFRSGLRLMLSHDRAGLAVACRGCVVSPPQTIDPGLLMVIGASW